MCIRHVRTDQDNAAEPSMCLCRGSKYLHWQIAAHPTSHLHRCISGQSYFSSCTWHAPDTLALQAGFFKHVVQGLFELTVQAFPSCDPILTSFRYNVAAWANAGPDDKQAR